MQQPIHRWFQAVAGAAPDRVALRTPRRAMTFGEICDAASRLAGELAACCAPGDRVAIATSEHAAVVPALLAILDAGCTFVHITARPSCLPIARNRTFDRSGRIVRSKPS